MAGLITLAVLLFAIGFSVAHKKKIRAFILNKKKEAQERKKIIQEQIQRKAEEIEQRSREREKLAIERRKREAEENKDAADAWLLKIERQIKENIYALAAERKRLVRIDPYGKEDDEDWWDWGECSNKQDAVLRELRSFNDDIFTKGIGYFWRHHLLSNEYDPSLYFKEWNNYHDVYLTSKIEGRWDSELGYEKDQWYVWLWGRIDFLIDEAIEQAALPEIDDMGGEEYEELCKRVAEDAGWEVQTTPATGDQGIDLILTGPELRIGVQCKRYSKPVGNKAVQEVAAGKSHYNCTHVAVVTNAGFTKQAIELAESNDVILLSTEEYVSLISSNEE